MYVEDDLGDWNYVSVVRHEVVDVLLMEVLVFLHVGVGC